MLWYMKHCNYEKLKPKLIRASMRHIRNESPEEIAYARDLFETIFRDYKQEKDVHISGLLADVMHQTPMTAADLRRWRENPAHPARSGLFLREDAGGSGPPDARPADRLCFRWALIHDSGGGCVRADDPGVSERAGSIES